MIACKSQMRLDDLIGLPFMWGGRGPDSYDCFGLVREVQRRRGINLPDRPSPQAMDFQAAMADSIASRWTEPLCKPEAFAVVVFNARRFGWHCGIVLDDCRRFIHVASCTTTVRIDLLDDYPWSKFIKRFFRCKNAT